LILCNKVSPTLKIVRGCKHIDLQQGYREFFNLLLHSSPLHSPQSKEMSSSLFASFIQPSHP
jgi:hypothetical protein